MKVFEVITERCEEGTTELTISTQYVTISDNSLASVAAHLKRKLEGYDEELRAVREVLVIVQQIEVSDGD